MDVKGKEKHAKHHADLKDEIANAMAQETTAEGRARVALTMMADNLQEMVDFTRAGIDDIAKGVEHGVK